MTGAAVDEAARRRIEALEREVQRLRGQVDDLQMQTAWQPVPATPDVPPGLAPPAAAPATKPTPRAGSAPAHEARGIESIIGTRWLAAAGITVSVLAAAMFLRLAISRGWIGPWLQLGLMVLLGVLVWALGAVLHGRDRFRGFSEVLAAGGVAITAFAAFATYGIATYRALGFTQELSATLLGLVAAVTLADAVLRRAQVQAGVTVGLVVITGVVALDWTAFAVGYPVVMTAAALMAGAWRRWGWLPLAAAPGPFLLLTIQAGLGAAQPAIAIAAATLIAMFSLQGLRARSHVVSTGIAQAVAWLAGWGLLVWSVQDLAFDVDGWLSLALGSAALALAFTTAANEVRLGWIVAGLTLLVVWPLMLPWPAAVAAVWASELVVAAALHITWRRPELAAVELSLAIGLLLRFLAREGPRIRDHADGYIIDILFYVAATAAAFAAWAMDRGKDWHAVAARLVMGAGVAFPVMVTIAAWDGPGVSLVIAGWATALTVAGFAARTMDLRIAGLSVFALVLLRVVAVDLADVDAIWRVLAFFVIGILLLGVSFLYVRSARQESRRLAAEGRPGNR